MQSEPFTPKESSLLNSLGILCEGSTNSKQHEALLLNARARTDYWLLLYNIAIKLINVKGNMSALKGVLIELKNWKHVVPIDRIMFLIKSAPLDVYNLLIGCIDTQFSLNGPAVLGALSNRQIPLHQRCVIASALTPTVDAAKTHLLRFIGDLLQQKPDAEAFDVLCSAIAEIACGLPPQTASRVIHHLVGPGMSVGAKGAVVVLLLKAEDIPPATALLLLRECGSCQCNVDTALYAQLMKRAPPDFVSPPVQWRRMIYCVDRGLEEHKKSGRLLDYMSLRHHPSPYLCAAETLYVVGFKTCHAQWAAETAKVTGMRCWIVWSFSQCLFTNTPSVFRKLKFVMSEGNDVAVALALACLIKTVKSYSRLKSPSTPLGTRRAMAGFCENCMPIALACLEEVHINVHRLLGLKLVQKIFGFMDGRITDFVSVVAGSVADARLLPGRIVDKIFPMVGNKNLCSEASTILYKTVVTLSPYFEPDVAASTVKNALRILVAATAEDTSCAHLHFAFEAVAHLLRTHFKPEIGPTGVRAAIGLLSPLAGIVANALRQCRSPGISFTKHGYFLQLLTLITKFSFVKPPPNLGTLGRPCSYLVAHLYALTLWTLKRMKQPSCFRMKHPDCELPVSSADKLKNQLLNVQPKIWLHNQRELMLEDLQRRLDIIRKQHPMLPPSQDFDDDCQLMECDDEEEEEGESVRLGTSAPWCRTTERRSRLLIGRAKMRNAEEDKAIFAAIEQQFCLALPPPWRSMFMYYSSRQKTLQQRLEHIVDTILERNMRIFKDALGELISIPGAYKQIWLLVNGHTRDVSEEIGPMFEKVRACPIVLNYLKQFKYYVIERASKQLDIPEGMFSGRTCAASLLPRPPVDDVAMPDPFSFHADARMDFGSGAGVFQPQQEEDGDVAMSEGPSAPGADRTPLRSMDTFHGVEQTSRRVETFFPRAKTLIADPSEAVGPLQTLIAYYTQSEPFVALLLMCDFTHVPPLMQEQFLYSQLQHSDDHRCRSQAAVCCALRMRDQPDWKPPQAILNFLVRVLEQPKYLTTCGWAVLLERVRLLGYPGDLPAIRKDNLNVEPYTGQGDIWHLAECEYF